MDHSDLVEELPRIERMTAAERLRLAKERRALQLRRYHQYNREKEKEDSLSKRQAPKRRSQQQKSGRRNVRFVESVMLLEAAARNDIDEVRRLLEKGVSPDSTNEDGLTALHQCCIDDSEEMMKLLIEYGANVNAEDSEKWTPLHAAATCGHLHLVNYLIHKGANLLAVNADGNMPYDICEDDPTLDLIESEMANRGVTQELIDITRAAVERQMLQDLKALAREGRSLEERNEMGATPLHIAAANGYLSVVEFLLDQHVATDVRDADEWQPIHAASCWGHIDVLELLVQNGADLSAQTKNHETPYDICEDGEMRSRILALKTELETKRLEAAHRGTRKSASSSASNPRTQSIRRTSIRDKTLTPKKDARNEALMRLQMEQGAEIANEISNGKLGKKHDPEMEDKLALTSFPAPPRSKTADRTQNTKSYNADNSLVPMPVPVPVNVDANSNGKIDIHVSVTFSAPSNAPPPPPPSASHLPALPAPVCPPPRVPSVHPQSAVTLADLKKHRALNRFHSWDLSVDQSVANGHAHLVGQNFTAADSHPPSSTHHKGRPPSPSGTKPVFVGESFEVVGDSHKRQLCCVII